MPRLTKNLIEKLSPKANSFWAWDSALPGFGVRVLPSGAKSFAVRTREHGTQRLITLGPTAIVGLDEARERAREIISGLKLKKNLRDIIGAQAGSPTVAELARQHQLVSKVKPATAESYRIYWESHIIPKLGKKQVASLTTLDIAKFHAGFDSIWSANRALKLLSKAFNDMAGWGHPWPKVENPTKGIKKFSEYTTERILTRDQAKALNRELASRVLNNPLNYTAWLLMVLQISGLRTGEWRQTPWEWVDLEEGILNLPTTKANRKRTVPLDYRVVKVLKMIPRYQNSKWIFPSIHNPRHFIGKPKKQWISIKSACKIDPKFRVHDLRHTFASMALVEAGLSIKEVGELMGHSQISTTGRYLHLLTDQQANAAKLAADAVLGG